MSRYALRPRQIVGVFHPTIADHELHLSLGEMVRRPARYWLTDILNTEKWHAQYYTHHRRRRDGTVEFSRVGGVYWA